jgi:hypothetical protein
MIDTLGRRGWSRRLCKTDASGRRRDGSRLPVEVVEYLDPDLWPEIARRRNEESPGLPHEDPDVLPSNWGYSSNSAAMYTAARLREQHPDGRIAQLYPPIGIFRSLEGSKDEYFHDRRIELWLLREDGEISLRGIALVVPDQSQAGTPQLHGSRCCPHAT